MIGRAPVGFHVDHGIGIAGNGYALFHGIDIDSFDCNCIFCIDQGIRIEIYLCLRIYADLADFYSGHRRGPFVIHVHEPYHSVYFDVLIPGYAYAAAESGGQGASALTFRQVSHHYVTYPGNRQGTLLDAAHHPCFKLFKTLQCFQALGIIQDTITSGHWSVILSENGPELVGQLAEFIDDKSVSIDQESLIAHQVIRGISEIFYIVYDYRTSDQVRDQHQVIHYILVGNNGIPSGDG